MARIVRADYSIQVVEPKNGTDFKLEELQAIAGGYIEIVRLKNGDIMVVNEEGHLKGLPLNFYATLRYQHDRATNDTIVGDVLICKSEQVK